MDPGSSSLDPLPEGIPSNAMTPEQKEGRLEDGDCGDGIDSGADGDDGDCGDVRDNLWKVVKVFTFFNVSPHTSLFLE